MSAYVYLSVRSTVYPPLLRKVGVILPLVPQLLLPDCPFMCCLCKPSKRYLFTSQVSTSARKPVGNARAYDVKAASSPSLASSGDASSIGDTLFRHSVAISRRLHCSRVSACCSVTHCMSSSVLNDVTQEWACVPFTGMLNILPAKTLLVPSKPPENFHYYYLLVGWYTYISDVTPPNDFIHHITYYIGQCQQIYTGYFESLNQVLQTLQYFVNIDLVP